MIYVGSQQQLESNVLYNVLCRQTRMYLSFSFLFGKMGDDMWFHSISWKVSIVVHMHNN